MQNVIEMQSAAEMQGSASQDNRASSDAESEDEDEYIALFKDGPLEKIIFSWNNLPIIFFFFVILLFVYIRLPFYCFGVDDKPLSPAEWVPKVYLYVTKTIWVPIILFSSVYPLYFWLDYASVPLPSLIYLLKQVEMQCSNNGEINWSQIAFSANELSYEQKFRVPVFFNGDHCMKYFCSHIVGAVKNKTYKVTFTCGNMQSGTFGLKQPQRDLLVRSVQSFENSINTK